MPEQRNIHYCSDDAENNGKCIESYKYRLPGPNRDICSAQNLLVMWVSWLCPVGNELSNFWYHS